MTSAILMNGHQNGGDVMGLKNTPFELRNKRISVAAPNELLKRVLTKLEGDTYQNLSELVRALLRKYVEEEIEVVVGNAV